MIYRELGNTGLKVSEIGMGCEGFAENNYEMTKELFDEAERLGINYFDLYTSNPQVRAAVGQERAVPDSVSYLFGVEKRTILKDKES